MEDMPEDHLLGMDLQVDADLAQHLENSGKWAKFISVIMFILCALILITAVIKISLIRFILTRLTDNFFGVKDVDEWVLWSIIVVSTILIASTYYFLYKFAKKIKLALLNGDTMQLNTGLRSLKIFFIIITCFSLLLLIKNIAGLF